MKRKSTASHTGSGSSARKPRMENDTTTRKIRCKCGPPYNPIYPVIPCAKCNTWKHPGCEGDAAMYWYQMRMGGNTTLKDYVCTQCKPRSSSSSSSRQHRQEEEEEDDEEEDDEKRIAAIELRMKKEAVVELRRRIEEEGGPIDETIEERIKRMRKEDRAKARREQREEDGITGRKQIYVCQRDKCKFRCPTDKELQEHLHSKHKTKLFTCEECKRTFCAKHNFTRHQKTHSNPQTLTCELCLFTSARASGLKLHMERKHNTTEQFPCEVCHKHSFFAKTDWKRHMKTHAENKKVVHTCDECDYSCAIYSNLERHQQKHTLSQSEERPIFSCCRCDYTCHQEGNFKRHVKTWHREEGRYACKSCEEIFDDKKELSHHRKEKHHLTCDVCHVKFSAIGYLSIHKRTHTGKKPFSCPHEDCSYTCTRKSQLQSHMKKHTDERPFACTICCDTFREDSHLKTHKLIHAEENPHACPHEGCLHTCKRKGNLQRHMKTHMDMLDTTH